MGVKYQSVSNLVHEALTLLRTLFPDEAIWFGLLVWFLSGEEVAKVLIFRG
jgi:hypothetical protein